MSSPVRPVRAPSTNFYTNFRKESVGSYNSLVCVERLTRVKMESVPREIKITYVVI